MSDFQNFKKTYDHVDWDFLNKVLGTKGFRYKWRLWMWGYVRNLSYSILINRSLKGKIKASRGLRQGNALSPFPFLLVVDVLRRLVFKGLEGNIIGPFVVGRGGVALSHLQLALYIYTYFV